MISLRLMKDLLFSFGFMLVSYAATAQNDFIGIAKYKMTVEGSSNPVVDSMSVVFGKQKVEVILYLPDLKTPGLVVEKIFIDDFASKKSIVGDAGKTYRTDTLNTGFKYHFLNTGKITAINNLLCFVYKADSSGFDTTHVLSAACRAGIDFRNSYISNYFFLGIQPIIIDNRIVMDFIVSQPNGIKQRVYVSDIKKMNDTEMYFNLNGYKEIK